MEHELGPILTAPLLPFVERQLLDLLDGLSFDDWTRPTIVPGWRVREVVAHLLDTATRKLAIVRDGFMTGGPASGDPQDLLTYIDRINADGVVVYGRLSPAVLRTMMASVSREFCDFHLSLDPFAPATVPVSWAGESASLNWFDTARELTERWHHQQQVRLALDRPGIMTREVYHPVIDCFMRVLPHAYRAVSASPGTMVRVRVDGPCGGDWHLVRTAEGWMLAVDAEGAPAATVQMPDDLAWRLFTKGLSREAAAAAITVLGDRSLAAPALSAVAIIG